MKTISLTFLVLVLCACTSRPDVQLPEEISSLDNLVKFSADSEPLTQVQLIPETVYGDTEDVLLGDWLSVHVDSRGRVFIGDSRETVIHLYNPDGTYNRQIWRSGEGPGEYQNIGPMRSDENYFYHYDNRSRRLTKYDINSFVVAGDVELRIEWDDEEAFFRSVRTFYLIGADDEILVQLGMGFRAGRPDIDLSQREMQGYLFNLETGTFSDQRVFTFPASEALVHFGNDGSLAVTSVPYKRSSVARVNNGQIIHGWNEHFLFRFYDMESNYRRAVYYDYPNPPLDRNEVLKLYEGRGEPWEGMVRNDDMPETWPSWSGFLMDDENRLWVERRTTDPDLTEFHLLDESGELLAVLPWDAANRVQHIQNGYLYSLEENEDGLREVVKYRIEM